MRVVPRKIARNAKGEKANRLERDAKTWRRDAKKTLRRQPFLISAPSRLGGSFAAGTSKDDASLTHGLLDKLFQIAVLFDGLKLGELLLHIVRRAKQEAYVGFVEHGCVIKRIACGYHVVIEQLESSYRALLLFGDSELVIYDLVIFDH